MTDTNAAALRVSGLTAGYGQTAAVRSVSLEVPRQCVTAVVGPNGAGKSTLMKCLAGVHRPWMGSIEIFGADMTDSPTRTRLAAGLALCPERRRIFPRMTVEENLLVGAVSIQPRVARARIAEAYSRFPWLSERRRSMGGNLSGGQQQMLVICRAMMSAPTLLLLDEPSLGLSPRVVGEVADLIRQLAATDITVLIVEQNVSLGLKLSDHVHVLNQGEIVRSGSSEVMQRDTSLVASYLG
jgi:branched-chain amino acid transport system ATP-binding protein